LIQPGAPGELSRPITPERAVELPPLQPTATEIRFMQGMIGHHAQALEMTALVGPRSSHDDLKLIAHRIALSQADEIKMMEEWLARRGQSVPDSHAHHGTTMPGMLTAEEMALLAASTGAGFDRLFIELMIKHHDGALIMVNELITDPDAGQDPELSAFASDVEVDQRGEIARLAAMLKELSK
jgi:uncharacterized protein (DUF305 family)